MKEIVMFRINYRFDIITSHITGLLEIVVIRPRKRGDYHFFQEFSSFHRC